MNNTLALVEEVTGAFENADRILIASDFDGTLCPIASTPDQVRVDPDMWEVLRRIADSERITMAVISGRALPDVMRRVPFRFVFAGNHGLEIRGPEFEFEHPCARRLRPQLAYACTALAELVRDWPGAWVEDKGLSATVHYRALDADAQNLFRREVRRKVLCRGAAYGLRAADKALELHPKVEWDKGSALACIRERSGPFDACLCLGDDYADERMFYGGPGQVNVKVGPALRTRAAFRLSGPAEVAFLLASIVGRRYSSPVRTSAAEPSVAQ